jgi:DNA-binding beta-propeller fold protein YncE
MRNSISFLLLTLTLLLNGCGGGGGGSSSSSSTTTSPTVFASGSSMAYLRQLAFDGNYLYVVDSNTSATSVAPVSYGHLRQISATSGSLVTTFEPPSTYLKDVFSFAKFNGSYLVTATIVGGNIGITEINASTYAFTNKAVLSSPYGLAVDSANKHLFAANQSANTVVVYDTSYTILKSICNTTTYGSCASSTNNADWIFPTGLAYDGSTYIYVTSFSGGNKGLYKIKTSDYSVTSITSSLFNNPNGIAVNTTTGDVYVVNTGSGDTDSSILKITSTGEVSTFLDGSVSSNMLCKPIGAAISGSYLYVSNGVCTTNSTYASSVIKINL